MPDEMIHLNYSKPIRVWKGPWQKRAVFTIALLIVIVSIWSAWTSTPGDWIRFHYVKYRCENHEARVDLPAFSCDPQMVSRMLHAGNEFSPGFSGDGLALVTLNPWKELERFFENGTYPDSVCFLRRRSAPDGESRLIAVGIGYGDSNDTYPDSTSSTDADSGGQKVTFHTMSAELIQDTGHNTFTPIKVDEAMLILPRGERFSLFEGTPDPADASRFTLRYTLRGKDGTIVGSLRPREKIYLQVLDGPLVLFDSGDYPYAVRPRATATTVK
jgi:hypothetical protein